jgi:hypothetical protein
MPAKKKPHSATLHISDTPRTKNYAQRNELLINKPPSLNFSESTTLPCSAWRGACYILFSLYEPYSVGCMVQGHIKYMIRDSSPGTSKGIFLWKVRKHLGPTQPTEWVPKFFSRGGEDRGGVKRPGREPSQARRLWIPLFPLYSSGVDSDRPYLLLLRKWNTPRSVVQHKCKQHLHTSVYVMFSASCLHDRRT